MALIDKIVCDKCGKEIEEEEGYFELCEDNTISFVSGNSCFEDEGHIPDEGAICSECAGRMGLFDKNNGTHSSKHGAEEMSAYLAGPAFCIEVRSNKLLKDLVLTPFTKQQINLLVSSIKNSERFIEWGLKEKFHYGTGIVVNFSGIPGTGKTLCAEALSNELGMKLHLVDYSSLMSKWVGETEKNIARVFREAKERTAILFFDEADAIASNRVAIESASDSYHNAETNVLLSETERFQGIVIFATNMPLNYDSALERRIFMSVTFEKPEKKVRVQLFKKLIPEKMPLAGDIDFSKLAEKEFTGGDIKNVIVSAARIAMHQNAKKVSMKHFQEAIGYVLKGKKVMGTDAEAEFNKESFVR